MIHHIAFWVGAWLFNKEFLLIIVGKILPEPMPLNFYFYFLHFILLYGSNCHHLTYKLWFYDFNLNSKISINCTPIFLQYLSSWYPECLVRCSSLLLSGSFKIGLIYELQMCNPTFIYLVNSCVTSGVADSQPTLSEIHVKRKNCGFLWHMLHYICHKIFSHSYGIDQLCHRRKDHFLS